MSPINRLLPLLSGVKSTGQRKWTACCPGHEDKSPSLAIRELDDGKLILHCFGGCSVLNVISSLSLTFNDLYPNNPQEHKRERAPFPALQTLKMVRDEMGLAVMALGDVIQGQPITLTDYVRLELARERLIEAIHLAGG